MHILGVSDPGVARNFYVPDISKTRYDLGLKRIVSLADAIRHIGKVLLLQPSFRRIPSNE